MAHHKCCDPRCGELKTSQNRLHSVPQDEKRRKAWELGLGMNLKKSHRVCSDHFKDSDYIPTSGKGLRLHLKRTAIPSPILESVETDNTIVMDEDEVRRRQEILNELEQVPSEMKVLPEDVPALQEEAESLLCCISLEECRVYVESYVADNGKEQSSVLRDSALGPFLLFPDMTIKLYDILDIYTENKNISSGFKLGKLLREVIIWSIEKHRNCSREEAEDYFEERNKKVEICKELQKL